MMKKIILVSILSLSFLMGCNQTTVSKTYRLTFYQDEGNKTDVMDVVVGTTTEKDVLTFQNKITLNKKRGYDVSWKKFDFKSITSDYTVNAKYVLHDYTISFVCNGEVIGTTTYNVLSKNIDEPVFKDEPGYTYTYDKFNFRNRAEDFSVQAYKQEAQYSVTFKTGEDDPNPIIRYYSISNPQVVTPEGKTGYNAKWSNGVVDIIGGETLYLSGDLQNYVFIGSLEAKKYTITYNPNGGTMESLTQTVTYDQPYTLKTVSTSTDLDYIGWFDEEDTAIAETGTWKIDDDVTLKAKWGFSFENGNVPSCFTALVRTSLSISTTEASHGNNSLKIDILTGGDNYQVGLTKSVLETMFEDPNVVAVNFDAKCSKNCSNFRSRHKEGTVNAWTYEENSNDYGLTTEWKTFTFKRAYLEGYVNIIEGWIESGNYVLVDNFRSVTKELDGLGFENGTLFDNHSYKDGGHANSSPAPIGIFNALGNPASVIKSMSFDYDIKSEGLRSMKIEKNNEYLALYISQTLKQSLGEDGYITFDLYTSIPIKSNPAEQNMVDGRSTGGPAQPLGGEGYQHPANNWVTYRIDAYKMTTDGRFLQVMGSTACNMYIDNIVIYK